MSMCFGERRSQTCASGATSGSPSPAAFLVLITVSLGLMGEPVFQLAQQAATQLFSRETYIQAVFAAAQGAK